MIRTAKEDADRLRDASSLVQATFSLHSGAFVLLLVAVISWVPERSPRPLLAIFAAAAFVLMIYTVRRGSQLSLREVYVMTAAVMVVIGVLTLTTGINLGALGTGAMLPMVGLYIVWFLPGPSGRTLLYGGCAWWLFAILQRGETLLTGLAVSLIIQVVIAAEVFAAVRARSDRLARLDMLTGVVNRRGVSEACTQHLLRLRERGIPFSIVSIDLDGLREVNNERGHLAGDAMLVEASQHWRSRLRDGDVLGRMGGDEFVIVLPGSDAVEATEIERRLRAGATVAWSAGVAQARKEDTLATLLHRADERMYRQKAERAAS